MKTMKIGQVCKLNRHMRGVKLVQIVELDSTRCVRPVDRVLDLETGMTYPALRTLLVKVRRKVVG